MPEALRIQVLQNADGASVYRVTAGVGGNLSIIRDFKTKEDAERFARPQYKGSVRDQKPR